MPGRLAPGRRLHGRRARAEPVAVAVALRRRGARPRHRAAAPRPPRADGTDEAILDIQVSQAKAEEAAGDTPIVRPIFEPGDALFFDELFLHQTGSDPSMPRPRYAIESWFFGAVVEVGAYAGDLTRVLVEWAEGAGARVSAVDPSPQDSARRAGGGHPELELIRGDEPRGAAAFRCRRRRHHRRRPQLLHGQRGAAADRRGGRPARAAAAALPRRRLAARPPRRLLRPEQIPGGSASASPAWAAGSTPASRAEAGRVPTRGRRRARGARATACSPRSRTSWPTARASASRSWLPSSASAWSGTVTRRGRVPSPGCSTRGTAILLERLEANRVHHLAQAYAAQPRGSSSTGRAGGGAATPAGSARSRLPSGCRGCGCGPGSRDARRSSPRTRSAACCAISSACGGAVGDASQRRRRVAGRGSGHPQPSSRSRGSSCASYRDWCEGDLGAGGVALGLREPRALPPVGRAWRGAGHPAVPLLGQPWMCASIQPPARRSARAERWWIARRSATTTFLPASGARAQKSTSYPCERCKRLVEAQGADGPRRQRARAGTRRPCRPRRRRGPLPVAPTRIVEVAAAVLAVAVDDLSPA